MEELNGYSVMVGLIITIITWYLVYTFLTKDNNDSKDINPSVYVYSSIISIIIGILGFYFYNKYNSSYYGPLLNDNFYSR